MDCELCAQPGGTLLWRDERCRVVQVAEADYPGFCRVIWNSHVREMGDLGAADRTHCMQVVFAVEQVLQAAMRPHKINLASLGNMVQHVHWHVIPRFTDDAHFPQPVWGTRQRDGTVNRDGAATATLAAALAAALGPSRLRP